MNGIECPDLDLYCEIFLHVFTNTAPWHEYWPSDCDNQSSKDPSDDDCKSNQDFAFHVEYSILVSGDVIVEYSLRPTLPALANTSPSLGRQDTV